eukprot:2579062-Pleurochrysis_carterae.AAC.2
MERQRDEGLLDGGGHVCGGRRERLEFVTSVRARRRRRLVVAVAVAVVVAVARLLVAALARCLHGRGSHGPEGGCDDGGGGGGGGALVED